jgi:hypothetical protein
MSTMSEGKFGTLLPKTIFNIVEKGKTLLDVADGILDKALTDADKTIMYLDK